MRILFIGDVSAKPGRLAIKSYLKEVRNQFDLIIANCENSAHGLGATMETIDELHTYGVDYFTSGNDIWHQPNFSDYLDLEESLVIRPLNYPSYYPGKGFKLIERGGKKVLLLNLIGTVFMKEQVLNPFHEIDDFLSRNALVKEADIILVDFHAEATSEKITMGFFLDGRVHAVMGTHTHVQTADERILAKGTAYITDVGMSGSLNSVLWVKYESSIKKSLFPYRHERYEVEEKKPWVVDGITLEIDKNNVVTSIKKVHHIVN